MNSTKLSRHVAVDGISVVTGRPMQACVDCSATRTAHYTSLGRLSNWNPWQPSPWCKGRKERMIAQWRVRYDGEAASWIVYRGNRMLRDYYPTKETAEEAAREANKTARKGGTHE